MSSIPMDRPERPAYRKPDVLEIIEELHRLGVAQAVVAIQDESGDLLLLELLVHRPERHRHDLVEEHAAHGRLDQLRRVPRVEPAHPDPRLETHVLRVVRHADLFHVREHAALAGGVLLLLGQVVDAEDHVLRRNHQRRAVRRRQDIVGRQHEDLRLELRLMGERHVHRHLVPVEVRVERRADERVDLDRLALDQDGLERLDPSRWSVGARFSSTGCSLMMSSRMSQTFRTLLLHHLFGGLDRRGETLLFELPQDERLEELEGHLLRQPALVELQLRPHHDDRAARVVDALAEEILTEPPLLALERVGERLQRPVVRAGDDAPSAAVVEQGVHRLLEHPLLVADNDLRRPELHEALQPVVPVDHPAVEVVEVRRREAAPVQRHQGAQLGRDDRDGLEDHPLGLVLGLDEGVHDLEPLDDLLPLLGGRLRHHRGAQLTLERLEVEVPQEHPDRLGPHADLDAVGRVLLGELPVLVDGDQVLLLEVRRARVEDDVLLKSRGSSPGPAATYRGAARCGSAAP
jgi:hypothetical protein